MNELRDVRAPGESDARRRAWGTASAAFDERPRAQAPRPWRRAALAAAAVAALLVGALSPPGDAVADWVGDTVRSVVREDRAPPRATGLDELPGGGRLLVLATPRGGTGTERWIVGDGPPRRLSGSVERATWSPQARFVAAAAGSELVALDLRGRRRWSLRASAPVEEVRWSPDGFRVAYRTESELRVVAGDGTGDRRVAAMEAGGPPAFGDIAWRPGREHVLAFTKRRSLFLADLDRRRVLWRVTVEDSPVVRFAPRGDRLLLAGAAGIRILSARDGRVLHRVARRRGTNLVAAAWSPAGGRIAVVRRTDDRADVLVGHPRGRLRSVFGARDLALVGFSPDGRWLLVHWGETRSWLFLPVAGGRARQVTGLEGRLRAESVVPQAWCCPP